MGGIKIKKISPKAVGNALKGAVKAAGNSVASAGKGVASAGKALGKCKPGDVKCAAKGMANLALSTQKVLLAASPMGVTYAASDKLSGGKIGKGVSAATKATLGVDAKDLASGDINKVGKALGKAAYKVSGAEQLVTAGKALAKCKPKDAACIAKNLAQIGSVAMMYVPGAGGAAAVAMKVGKTAVQNAVKKEVEAVAKKKIAKDKQKRAENKLREARSEEEKRAALSEVEDAKRDVAVADVKLNKVQNEKVAAEKQLNDAAIVVVQQGVAEKAYKEQQEAASKYPEQAAEVNATLHPGDPAAQAAEATAKTEQSTQALLQSQNEIAKGIEKLSQEPVYFGIPQSKLILIGISIFFLLVTIMILKP